MTPASVIPTQSTYTMTDFSAIAVLLPTLNEENTVVEVVESFRQTIPEAKIYVYDNNSSDNTASLARQSGAIVRTVYRRGKGNVMASMFAEIHADIYILCDADATYNASDSAKFVEILRRENLDMVIGQRNYLEARNERFLHLLGNKLLTKLVATIFHSEIGDMLSGYRVMTKRYVRAFPCLSSGFSVETEMTINLLSLRVRYKEIPTDYRERRSHSHSKLNTFSDGLQILATIVKLTQAEKPFAFYTSLAFLFALISITLGIPVIFEYFESGLVPRFPTAILAASMGIVAYTSLVTGIIVSAATAVRKENQRFQYLNCLTHKD